MEIYATTVGFVVIDRVLDTSEEHKETRVRTCTD